MGCFQILELVCRWWEPNSPRVDLWHARDGAMTPNISGTPLIDGAPRAHSIIFILEGFFVFLETANDRSEPRVMKKVGGSAQ